MDKMSRYLDESRAITAPTTPCGLSIGSPSQRFFESDNASEIGTCNGFSSHPGSKSNLLLCIQCDLEARACSYRPHTPSSRFDRYIEEDRAKICDECDCHCPHCNINTHDETDLICFRCEDEDPALCSTCEEPITEGTDSNGKSGPPGNSSSSDNGHYPVDAVVKIQVNDQLLDVDSDDGNEGSSNRDAEGGDRLSPIVEHVSAFSDEDNGQESNGSKINGQARRYLDSMLVLFV
ncbi:uncharacterized protein LOC107038897 [Diachasma alloeum]|uniref:uncharacterized protein LOC107038897 n=1 Tax=Diachasma alloeum TaxID=454923 RepID=UPI0007381192|nr:uncharacterized protein LOC107038897 [Diachasma alloeum]